MDTVPKKIKITSPLKNINLGGQENLAISNQNLIFIRHACETRLNLCSSKYVVLRVVVDIDDDFVFRQSRNVLLLEDLTDQLLKVVKFVLRHCLPFFTSRLLSCTSSRCLDLTSRRALRTSLRAEIVWIVWIIHASFRLSSCEINFSKNTIPAKIFNLSYLPSLLSFSFSSSSSTSIGSFSSFSRIRFFRSLFSTYSRKMCLTVLLKTFKARRLPAYDRRFLPTFLK